MDLIKEMKDLHTENYKTLMKEIEEDWNKWENIMCSWIGRQYFLNVCTPQSNLQIQCSLYQNANCIFYRNRKKILKFIWNHKRFWVVKIILIKNTKMEVPHFLFFSKGVFLFKVVFFVCLFCFVLMVSSLFFF